MSENQTVSLPLMHSYFQEIRRRTDITFAQLNAEMYKAAETDEVVHYIFEGNGEWHKEKRKYQIFQRPSQYDAPRAARAWSPASGFAPSKTSAGGWKSRIANRSSSTIAAHSCE